MAFLFDVGRAAQPLRPIIDSGDPLASGLLHYWVLDNPVRILDVAGAFPGTVSGPTFSYGQEGTGLNYDGTSDWVDCGDVSNINFGAGDFSLGIRATFNAIATRAILLGKDDAALGRQFHFATGNSANGSLDMVIGTTTVLSTAANAVAVGILYDIVFTRQGSTNTFYVNGAAIATGSNSTSMTDEAAPLYIGARSYAGFNDSVNGRINRAFIYNRALSSTEVAVLRTRQWRPFRGERRLLLKTIGGSTPTNITATTGTEAWKGITASLNVRTAITGTVAAENWNGLGAVVKMSPTILGTTGVETWNGIAATIIATGGINAGTGTEAWGGLSASVKANVNITPGTGHENWNGLSANIQGRADINPTVGIETWRGLTASVTLASGAVQISAITGTELWGGNAASITGGGIVTGRANRVFRPAGKHMIYQKR